MLVHSSSLTPAQLDKLHRGLARTRDYTAKLVDRMSALQFPDADPPRIGTQFIVSLLFWGETLIALNLKDLTAGHCGLRSRR
jgi:hypothetical protein